MTTTGPNLPQNDTDSQPFGVYVTTGSSLGRYYENYHPCVISEVLYPERLIHSDGKPLRFATWAEAQAKANELHAAFYANWDDDEPVSAGGGATGPTDDAARAERATGPKRVRLGKAQWSVLAHAAKGSSVDDGPYGITSRRIIDSLVRHGYLLRDVLKQGWFITDDGRKRFAEGR